MIGIKFVKLSSPKKHNNYWDSLGRQLIKIQFDQYISIYMHNNMMFIKFFSPIVIIDLLIYVNHLNI